MKMAVVPGLAAVIAVLALFGEPAHALSTGCSAISGNIVQNCGFETGDTSNWTGGTFANGDFVSSAFAHNGTYGLGFGNDGATTPLSQTLATSTGTTYAISFWVDGQALYTDEISLSWGGTRILDVVDIPAGWTKYSFTETASAGSTVLQFGLRDDQTFDSLDDIAVTPVNMTEPSSLLILAAMPIGLGLIRRRRRRPGASGRSHI